MIFGFVVLQCSRITSKNLLRHFGEERAKMQQSIGQMRVLFTTLITALFGVWIIESAVYSYADSGPVCPSAGIAANPASSAVGADPNTAIWEDKMLSSRSGCRGISTARAKLIIALAAQFNMNGSGERLASRIGAISKTRGMQYWSVTDGEMRVLLDDSFALSSSNANARRADFTSTEVLSGTKIYFAQDDTRSTGINIYSLETVASGSDHITFDVVNETAIRYGPIILFAPGALRSRHFFRRVSGEVWSYYGLTVIEDGRTFGLTRSFVNRGLALYRHLSR